MRAICPRISPIRIQTQHIHNSHCPVERDGRRERERKEEERVLTHTSDNKSERHKSVAFDCAGDLFPIRAQRTSTIEKWVEWNWNIARLQIDDEVSRVGRPVGYGFWLWYFFYDSQRVGWPGWGKTLHIEQRELFNDVLECYLFCIYHITVTYMINIS